MITINKQPEEYGDRWHPCHIGSYRHMIREYKPAEFEGINMLRLYYFAYNSWNSLRLLADHKVFDDAAVQKLQESAKYHCPITYQTCYALLPVAIFSDDLDKYFNNRFKPWYHEMAVDQSWNCEEDNSHLYKFEKLSTIQTCILGPGYTEGTLPDDGSPGYEVVVLDLSNGDKMVAVARTWYNK